MKCALLIYFSAFGVLCFTPAGNGYAQTPANDPHWELLWRDEFDGLDLDPNRWIVANDCDHGGDPQLYIPEQVSVLNGSLKLTAEKRAYTSPSTPWVTSWSCGSCLPDHTYSYVSGWVESRKDNTPVNYGYIEAPDSDELSIRRWAFSRVLDVDRAAIISRNRYIRVHPRTQGMP